MTSKKQIIRKRSFSAAFYGLVFLITLSAYYFVNTSFAQNVIKLKISVADEKSVIIPYEYEQNIAEDEKEYNYKLPQVQNGFVVSKYTLISESEFENLKENQKKYEDDLKKKELQQKQPADNTAIENVAVSDITPNTTTNTTKNTTTNTKEAKIKNESTTKSVENKITNNTTKETETKAKNNETTNAAENKSTNNTITKKNDTKVVDNTTSKKTENTVTNNTINNSTKVTENKVTNNTTVKDAETKVANNESSKVPENNTNTNTITSKVEKTTLSTVTPTPKKKTEDNENKYLLPDEEYKLTEKEIKNKKIYLSAVYDIKEEKDITLYNKLLIYKTEKHIISVNGYMPEKAQIKVSEVDVKETESKINKKNKSDVKLKIAYDIKIEIDGKEYEPNEFDENVKVNIEGIESQNINIWHIKNDNTVEKMNTENKNNAVSFSTNEFSIYGIEELDNEEEINEKTESNEEIKIESNKDNNVNSMAKGEPLRAPAQNLPDSTLIINDYTSDYNYYQGKNYTDNMAGVYRSNYTSSNLIQLTLNYHGFANGETDPEKKGRISLTETQDIVQNIRCVPVTNGNITVELMENPFMDKPTGYGFGGWTVDSNVGTVTQNAQNVQTLTYSLTASVSGNTTIDLYANWIAAKVIYVNQVDGNDNLYDGLSEEHPFGSWQKACQTLYNTSTNRNDRERNIIVVTR